MKMSLTLAALRPAILGLAIAVGISAQGAATVVAKQNTVAATGRKKAVVAAGVVGASSGTVNALGLLDQAYGLMRTADHDYKGHRARAMRQVEDAARDLGSRLSGDGRDHENQGASDEQLRNAQSLLQQSLGGLAGRPLHHVEEAIKQLGIALTVK
jgi:hypothetical protein